MHRLIVALQDPDHRATAAEALRSLDAEIVQLEPSVLGCHGGDLTIVDGEWLLKCPGNRPAHALALIHDPQDIPRVLAAGAQDCVPAAVSAEELLWRVRVRLSAPPACAPLTLGCDARRLFSDAPAMIATSRGPDHQIDFANETACTVWDRSNVEGSTFDEAFPELAGQGFREMLDEVYRTGVPFRAEEVLCQLRRNGSSNLEDVYFTFVYSPRRNAIGAIEGVLVFAFDVTRHVRAREEARQLTEALGNQRRLLAESESKFRWLAEAMPQYVWITDEACRVEYLNEASLKATGATLEQMKGFGWLDLVHPDDAPRVRAQVEQSIATGDPFESEFRIYSATEGFHRWGLARGLPQCDASGRLVHWFGTVTDIHDQKRMSEANARLAAIVASSPDAITSSSLDGTIDSWNEGAVRLFGYTAQEMIGRTLEVLVPENLREQAREMERRVFEGGVVREHQTQRLHQNGKLLPVALTLSLIQSGDGKTIGVAAMYRDVAEREQLRAQLAVTERMASVGTLAAGVAHEVNNPLAYIIANLGYSLDGLRKDSVVEQLPAILEALEETRRGVERIREIVRDLKVFSRSEEERTGSVALPSVIRTVLTIASNEIRHRAQLVTSIGEVPRVTGNESRLAQVLLNLVLNAAQAIREGAADRNFIRVTLATAENGDAVIEVEDTGEGIAPEVLPRIFNPFFTTKPVGFGTGLGLYVCHGIVEKLGGRITVHSRPGQGTRFRVTLPPEPSVVPAETPSAHPLAPPRRARVVVIDDDPLVCKATRRLLAAAHDTEVFFDAREALPALLADPPDVVLCDLMMPSMSGEEFYRQLESEAPALARRVILLTGGAFTPESVAFCDRMQERVVEKPVDPATLQARIRAVLEETGRRAA